MKCWLLIHDSVYILDKPMFGLVWFLNAGDLVTVVPEGNAPIVRLNVQDPGHHNHEEATELVHFGVATLTPHHSETDRTSLELH